MNRGRKLSVKGVSAILVTILGLVNITAMSIFSFTALKRNIERDRWAQSNLLLDSSMSLVERQLIQAEELVRYMIEIDDFSGQRIDLDRIKEILHQHRDLAPEIDALMYMNDQGEIASTKHNSFPTDYDPTKRPWYTESSDPVWSEPFIDYFDQHILFALSARSNNTENNKSFSIAAFYNVADIWNFQFPDGEIGPDQLFLVSSGGIVIANNQNAMIGSDIFQDLVLNKRFDDMKEQIRLEIGSEPYSLHIRPELKTGMYIISAVNEYQLRRRLYRSFLGIFILELGFVLIISTFTYLLVLRGIKPLDQLVKHMSVAEKGDYATKSDLNQYYEISVLSEQFNRMLIGIKSRDEILKHRAMRIKNLAYYDSLTGLPNRIYLHEQLKKILEVHANDDATTQSIGAIFYLDLDGFKTINDTMGHSSGDRVLQIVADRLSKNLRAGQFAVRLGGDEFVVVLDRLESVDLVSRIASRFLESLYEPIMVDVTSFEVGASIGVVIYPTQGVDAENLLKKADMAMYRAKRNGKNTYQLFEENLEDEILIRNRLEREIRRSVRMGMFHFHYQPIYDMQTEEIVGFEALLRTSNPNLQDVSIEEIILIAEETAMITEIEKHVFATGFQFLRKVRKLYNPKLNLSVNVSSSHIMRSDFVDNFLHQIEECQVDPHHINLEVTESIMMKSMKVGQERLNRLREQGIRIHLDDFGTGYSSLSYLQNLPIQCVKMDKSFINTIENDEKNRRIVSLMVDLAHGLGIGIVAEGLETDAQREMLRKMKFDYCQGYLMSRPLPEAGATQVLANSLKKSREVPISRPESA